MTKRDSKKPAEQLIQFIVEDLDVHSDIWLWGSEPIYHNDKAVGNVSSASYSPSLGKLLCFGQVQHSDSLLQSNPESGVYEIDIAGKRCKASIRIV